MAYNGSTRNGVSHSSNLEKHLRLEDRLSSDKKPVKIGDEVSGLLLNGKDVHIEEDLTIGGDSTIGGDLAVNGGDITTNGDITLNSDGNIKLDSATGVFEMLGAGTVAKFADMYAGMILGYTDIGLNEARADLSLTTSYVVPTDEHSVAFTAPPSGNVEISMQVAFSAGATGQGDLHAGLSTANATSGYSALQDYHEEELVDQSGRSGWETVVNSWTLTGLTAGTAYEYWVGFKSTSTGGTPTVSWGGDASGHYSDFILKAIALPATITT